MLSFYPAINTPGKEYALYLHHGRPVKGQKPQYTVDAAVGAAELGLDLPAGAWRTEWIDTRTGKVAKQERFSHRGGPRPLASPRYSEDIALRIRVQ